MNTSHVTQTIATVPGRQYALSLAYSPKQGREATDTVELWWNGVKLDTLSGLVQDWQAYRYTLKASNTETLLELKGLGDQGGWIDDVRLYPLPETNLAPAFTSTPVVTATMDALYEYATTAIDPEGNTVRYTLLEGPGGMVLNSTNGLLNWTPLAPGTVKVTLAVEDPQGAQGTQSFTLEVAQSNQTPEITSIAPTTAMTGTAYHYTIAASDPENDTLSYHLQVSPQGMTIDPQHGQIEWLPQNPGIYAITVQVQDPQGAAATQSYAITVQAAPQPPVITSEPPRNAIVDSRYQYPVIATDSVGEVLTYQLIEGPLGMQLNPETGMLQWIPVDAGRFTITLQVEDLGGLVQQQSYVLNVVNAATDQAPSLQPIGSQPIILGTPFTLQLSGSDPQGQPVTYGVRPLPLPLHAELNAHTGVFTFKPQADQAGDYQLTFYASDGRFEASETITLHVTPADPGAPTRMTGRVLDGTAKAQGLNVPIVGGTVSFIGSGVSARTDSNGYFTLSDIPDGLFVFSIDNTTAQPAPEGSGYASYRIEKALIAHANNVIYRPFTLPRLAVASQTPINPTETAEVDNTNISVKMTVAAGTAVNKADGTPFTGELSISEVPPGLTPGSMPSWLSPGLVITIQPLGVVFATPAPISFPNIDQLEPGTETDIWSLNPDIGKFEVVGRGRISDDGQQIETISGGVRQSDWHFTTTTVVERVESTTHSDNKKSNTCTAEAGSSVSLSDGRLNNSITLPAYRSLQTTRPLRFHYQSQRAAEQTPSAPLPHRISYKSIRVRGGQSAPAIPVLSTRYSIAGMDYSEEVYSDINGVRGGDTVQSSLGINTTGLHSGLYAVELTHTSNMPFSRTGFISQHTLLVINESNSPFGAGWMLDGVDKIGAGINGGRLVIHPGEEAVHYRKTIDNDTFISPEANFSTLTKQPDGGYVLTDPTGMQRRFNGDGVQIATVDRNQNTTRYEYQDDQLVRIVDPVGQATVFNYSAGYLSTVIDPAERTTVFTHNSHGDLVVIEYPDGSREQFEYTDHRMTAHLDERGNRTTYQYDDTGRLVGTVLPDATERASVDGASIGLPDRANGEGTQSQPLQSIGTNDPEAMPRYRDGRGHQSKVKLDAHGHPTQHTDALGRVTMIQRDADSNPTRITRPNRSVVTQTFDEHGNVLTRTEAFNSASTRFTYDTFSQVTSITNPNQHTTTLDRDAQGNVTSITNARGHTAELSYDSRGLVTRLTEANGLLTEYHYTGQGLLSQLSETTPNGHQRVTQYQYDTAGNMTLIETPDGVTLTLSYDRRGRVIQIRDNLGQVQALEYDAHGNVIATQTQDPEGQLALSVNRAYDVRNRLIRLSTPHTGDTESIYQFTLDENSNRIGTLDPRQNLSQASFDPVDRLTTQTHRLEGITRYQYDNLDRVTQVTAPNGAVTHYRYDALGRVTSETSPDRGTLRYHYDVANNVIELTDARGVAAQYEYDDLERLVEKRLPDSSESVTYTYDTCDFGIGRLCAVDDESGRTEYHYDAFGNIIEVHHTELGQTYSQTYEYDDGDQVTRQTLPSGRTVTYQRDGVRRIEAVSAMLDNIDTPLISEIRYRADNRLTQCTYDNGVQETRQYDLQGRLTDDTLEHTGSPLAERHYAYDVNGNLIQRQQSADTDNSQIYQYDALDRLDSEKNDEATALDYTYGLNDNRLSLQQSPLHASYQYQAESNRLQLIETDRLGDIPLPIPPPRQLVYNDAGRLFQVIEDDELKATYTYNTFGQRTRKVTATGTTVYHYDLNGQLISETQTDGRLIRDYIRVNGIARVQIDAGERLSYLHSDHLDTPRLATDSRGIIVWRWEGEAFGGAAVTGGVNTEINLRFPGQYFDAETGWFYNYFRYYDPATGRYITSDPIGLDGGLNTYAYVNGNPLIYSDSNGLYGTLVFNAGRAALTALTGAAIGHGVQGTQNALNENSNNNNTDPYDPTNPNWKPWGPFPNPDTSDDDVKPGSGTVDDCIAECMPYIDIGDGGAKFHKCMADCKRKNDLFPSCE